MQMKKVSMFAVLALVLAAAPIFSGKALAGDCGQDPVYEKNFQAKAVISSRVRDIACMEGSEVISIINQGSSVSVIASTDGWYKVELSDGRQGWVGATLLKATTENIGDAVKEIITEKKEIIKEKISEKSDPEIAKRVAGYILLQVQQRGEAYYVAEDGVGYYMKNGEVAYEMMRQFGLGINKANLSKLKAKNAELVKRLKGKIVLDVETNGEAYYIYPKDGSLHYLKNGEEAYKIMRKLGLGITNNDLKKIAKKEIKDVLKAKKEAVKIEKKKVVESVKVSGEGSIVLKAAVEGEKVKLAWLVEGMETPLGFKVVVSTNANPVYPGNEYHYLSDSQVRGDYWKGLPAGTYHFRVCEYLGGSCGVYSNDAQVTIASEEPEVIEEAAEQSGTITLNASKTDTGINLTWSLADMVSENGFKLVWSTSENPVYPGNDYHYLSNMDTRADTVSDLESGTTYNFRVCEYLGGACGVYSNNVTISY